MTVTVSPMNSKNTHHVKLSDGVTDLGLILCDRDGNANPRAFTSDPVVRQSIKMYSGEQRHSDLEPPWTDAAQDDFSGGRGSEKLELDTSRYWDSRQIDTTNGGFAVLAPLEFWDKAWTMKFNNQNWPTYEISAGAFSVKTYNNIALYSTQQFVATSFTTPDAYTAVYVYFYAKVLGATSGNQIYVGIHADSGGSPDSTAIDSDTIALTTELKLNVATISAALSASTTYWLVFGGQSADTVTNHVEIIGDSSGGKKASSLAGAWAAGSGDPYYRVEEAAKEFRAHFGELKGMLYCAAEYTDGTVSRVFYSGVSGNPTSATASYIRDTNRASTITNDRYNGGVIRILHGTGYHIPSPWRYISDTLSSNQEIDVTPDWSITPDATSWYAVSGSDWWNETTTHGLAAGEYITDMLAAGGALYFACGPGTYMLRLRNFWATGTYNQWTDEADYATFLERLTDEATSEIWAAHRTIPSKIKKAPELDCTGTGTVSTLTFAPAKTVGELGEKITGMNVYGEETPELYIFKEGSIHKLVAEVPQELRISGLREAADERNGHASGVNGVYLYFSFLDSVQRYYSGSLDNISWNRDGGMPSNRRGMAAGFVAYPGILYAAIDGGASNYSSIVAWNGQGWHEIWRAPIAGKRILGNLYIQPVPGDNVDRLYFSWNGDIVSLPVAGNPYELNSQDVTSESFQFYPYAPGGSIELPWFHFGLENVDKLINSITVVGQNMTSTNSRVFVDYKIDDDDDWTDLGQVTFSGDVGEVLLDSSTYNVTGKRIRPRIRLETNKNNNTPKLTAVIVEGLVTVPSKQKVTMTFRLEDYGDDLLNKPDDISDADTKLAQLRTWAASAGTIGMSGCVDELNGLRVKLDYPSMRVVKHEVLEVNNQKRNRYIVQTGAWVIA